MAQVAAINGQPVDATDLVKYLKLSGQYDTLIEELLMQRIAVDAAAAEGIKPTPEQVQDSADKLRRVMGLHKAPDMLDYLDSQGLEVSDFERFMTDATTVRQIRAKVASKEAIDGYYALHEPSFRQADISIIVLDRADEDKAREMAMTLRDIPEDFMAMAIEYSIDESAKNGGRVGLITHSELNESLANEVFKSDKGGVVGPVLDGEGDFWQIVLVNEIRASNNDDDTRQKIAKVLYEEWLENVSNSVEVTIS